ncbi:MAG: hypothetical protein E6K80_02535 [Candidatus Eisenbacteria bacterium]|uniref:Uncharacterized protein n=1 Tax=Eiseniibacteriota bacterium TaxID=2212470 RepID=A0A538U9G0_UNCEI|nr:MAG: hypothetical protein E6K80_02535 [Candidatus Eisenbacteria bacterium]
MLGREPAPLPFATTSVRERGSMRTAVGYQPVGRNPIAFERPGWLTSKTATWFAPAFATYRRSPFASSVSPLGVSPTGSLGVREVRSISTVRPAATSTTATLLTFELATNTREPSGDSARSVGWSPTGMTRAISSEAASTMARFAALHIETYTRDPSRETRQVYGTAPSGMRRRIRRAGTSTTFSAESSWDTT